MSIPDAAIEAAAIHLFQIDRDRNGRGLVDWKYASDYEREFFRAEAVAVMSPAMPAIREALAQELQDYADGTPRTTTDPNAYARMVAYENAARIVRGGTP